MPEAHPGLLAEFADPEGLVDALRCLRAMGLRRLDALTPFPVDEAEEALELPRSPIPAWVLAFGLLGASGMYVLQVWINLVDYPYDVGGRPLHSGWAFVPLTVEGGILAAALASFFGWVAYCGLPRLWHPTFEVEGFDRVTIDRFFVQVDGSDPEFHPARLREALWGCGALSVRDLGEAP